MDTPSYGGSMIQHGSDVKSPSDHVDAVAHTLETSS